jgi:hypothetical protein
MTELRKLVEKSYEENPAKFHGKFVSFTPDRIMRFYDDNHREVIRKIKEIISNILNPASEPQAGFRLSEKPFKIYTNIDDVIIYSDKVMSQIDGEDFDKLEKYIMNSPYYYYFEGITALCSCVCGFKGCCYELEWDIRDCQDNKIYM